MLVKVFGVVMPCGGVVGYQHFRGPHCLQLHPEDGGRTLVSYHSTTRHHNLGDLNLNIQHHENLKSSRIVDWNVRFAALAITVFRL
jgi:hypothetical protein